MKGGEGRAKRKMGLHHEGLEEGRVARGKGSDSGNQKWKGKKNLEMKRGKGRPKRRGGLEEGRVGGGGGAWGGVGGVGCQPETERGDGGLGRRKEKGECEGDRVGLIRRKGVGSAVEATVRFTRNRPGLPVLTV